MQVGRFSSHIQLEKSKPFTNICSISGCTLGGEQDHCQVLPLSNWDLLLQDAEGSGRRPKMVDVPRVLKVRTM